MKILKTYHHTGRTYVQVKDTDGTRVEFSFRGDKKPTHKELEDLMEKHRKSRVQEDDLIDPAEAELERVKKERDMYKEQAKDLQDRIKVLEKETVEKVIR